MRLSASSIASTLRLGELLELLLGARDLVVADLALQRVEVVLRLAADVADRHLGVLGLGAHDLDVLLAALLGELGQGHADDVAVVRGFAPRFGVSRMACSMSFSALLS